MPVVTPYIPQQITVHLGPPDSDAANVTVNFIDYVKNVASSEIYPTWEESALHLGPPDSDAANVTVNFIDYVKNVASSEIYPTWEESALRANILAITTFALNRVYTEFYRSRGYPFDITSSTAYDQFFVNGRLLTISFLSTAAAILPMWHGWRRSYLTTICAGPDS